MSVTCALTTCGENAPLGEKDTRIEVQAAVPSGGIQKLRSRLIVNWNQKGQATFHPDCWLYVLFSARARNKKNKRFPIMIPAEKSMLIEAAKTVEGHDSEDVVELEAKRIADMIRSSRHCVCFTGAGLSTAAGIGDYRGKSGKWTQMDREKVQWDERDEEEAPPEKRARLEDTQDDSSEEEEEEEEDGVLYEKLRPTYSHEALVKLLEDGYLKYCISQNGDGLHLLSGIPEEKISELHGNVFVEKCEKCGHRYHRSFDVMDDEASQYYEDLYEHGTTSIKKPSHAKQCKLCKLSHRTGRKCDQKTGNGKVCGGHLMDSIINFRDLLEEEIMTRATDNARRCDLMLCLGTTLTVTPARDLVKEGVKPLRIVICNRQTTHMDREALQFDPQGSQLGSRVYGDCDRLFRHVMSHLYPGKDLKKWESEREKRMAQYHSQRDETD